MKKTLAFLGILLMIITMSSCKKDGTGIRHKVTFNLNAGEYYGDTYPIFQNVYDQKTITNFSPERKNYDFHGWTLALTNPIVYFDPATPITEPITLFAVWDDVVPEITVTFDLCGGTYQDTTDNVVRNITKDARTTSFEPTRELCTFTGWAVDLNNPDQLFDFESPIEDDLTLYAVWEGQHFQLAFYSYDYGQSGMIFSTYATRDDLVADFLNDFQTFSGRNITANNFFDASYGRLCNSNGFFGSTRYYEKWSFLLLYLRDLVPTNLKYYFTQIHDYPKDSAITTEGQALVRKELQGFLLGAQYINTNWPSHVTLDYSDLQYGDNFWDHCQGPRPNEYEYGKEYILPTPHRKNSVFLGWFDENDNPVTRIPVGTSGNKYFVARFKEYTRITYVGGEQTWNTKEDLFTSFFTDFYNFIITKCDANALTSYNINSASDFLVAAKDFNAGNGQMTYIGDISCDYFLAKDIWGSIENQPASKFVGYCYQNGLYTDVLPFFINFFSWWRADEGYTTPTNNGSDFFAESWAPVVDIAKFFYYSEYTSYVKTPRVLDCFRNIPGVLSSRDLSLPAIHYGLTNVPLSPLTRTGYTFGGWYLNPEFTGNSITSLLLHTPPAITLYAKWTKNPE